MSSQDEALQSADTVENLLKECAILATDPENQGKIAWEALFDYQALLADNNYDLTDDGSYSLAGLAGYKAYADALRENALFEASCLYDIACEGMEDIAAGRADDIPLDNHPCTYLDDVYIWLKRSGLPLLADSTYERIGSTRTDFFDGMTAAHVHAVKVKLALCAGMPDTEYEAGVAIMDEVLNSHFRILGFDEESAGIEDYLGADITRIKAIHTRLVQQKFKAQMAVIEGFRRFHRDVPAYHDAVIAAAHTLQIVPDLDIAPGTFSDSSFNAQTFSDEIYRCTDHVLARTLASLVSGDISGVALQQAIKEITDLRSLFYYVPAPEGTPFEYMNEDFWCANILKEFGFRSYSYLYEQLQTISAQAIINTTLANRQAKLTEVYEDLMEAEAILQDIGFPLDNERALAGIGVDKKTFNDVYLEASLEGAYRDWNYLHGDLLDIKTKVKVLMNLNEAYERLKADGSHRHLYFNRDDLDDLSWRLDLRMVEELLADHMLCLDPATSYDILKRAYDLLDAQRFDMLNPQVHERMGLSCAQAEYIDDTFGMMELAQDWLVALNQDNPLENRFESATRFAARYATLGAEQVQKISDYLGDKAPLYVEALVRDIARALYPVAMQEEADYITDPVRAYKAMALAEKCATALNPVAMKSALHFKAVTGDDLAAFLEKYDRYKAQAEAIAKPLVRSFMDAGGLAARLSQALKPENRGRKAYEMISSVARSLRGQGRSILDADILKSLGMSGVVLKSFLDVQAMTAAIACVEAARAQTGMAVTMDTVRNHPYQALHDAGKWVSRVSTHTVLADAHWQKIGFESRDDYAQACREALLDLTIQLERLAVSDGMARGPFGMLQMLNDIRMASASLGIETAHDIKPLADQDVLNVTGGAIDVTQRAIYRFGYTVIKQIATDKLLPSAKVKKMGFVYDFASRMKVTLWKSHEQMIEINTLHAGAIRERIETVVARYNRNMGTPARGTRLAVALKDVADRYTLRGQPWFQGLFHDMNYHDFDAFCDHMTVKRIHQIVERTKNTVAAILEGTAGKVPGYHGILIDMLRLEGLASENGLISERRRSEILQGLGKPHDWHGTMIREAAPHVLPLMVRQIQDPTQTDMARWEGIFECWNILQRLNADEVAAVKLDKKKMAAIQEKTGLRIAALYLAGDAMQIDRDVVSPAYLNAANMLGMIGRTRQIEALGLSAAELGLVQSRADLLPVYTAVQRVLSEDILPPESMYEAVTALYKAAGEYNLDLDAKDDLRRLGINDPQTFRRELDGQILWVLRMFNDSATKLQGEPLRQRDCFNAIVRFMDTTGIHGRVKPEGFKMQGIRPYAEVLAAITTGALPVRQRYMAPPAPANNN